MELAAWRTQLQDLVKSIVTIRTKHIGADPGSLTPLRAYLPDALKGVQVRNKIDELERQILYLKTIEDKPVVSNKNLDKEECIEMARCYWRKNPDLLPVEVATAILNCPTVLDDMTNERFAVSWRLNKPGVKTLKGWIAPSWPRRKKGAPRKIRPVS